MLDLQEIEHEIAKLEAANTTFTNCEKLTVLYTVRDHMANNKAYQYSYYSDSDPALSDFLQAVNRAPIDAVLQIIDEHMTTIEALYPKEYSSIMRKIQLLNKS